MFLLGGSCFILNYFWNSHALRKYSYIIQVIVIQRNKGKCTLASKKYIEKCIENRENISWVEVQSFSSCPSCFYMSRLNWQIRLTDQQNKVTNSMPYYIDITKCGPQIKVSIWPLNQFKTEAPCRCIFNHPKAEVYKPTLICKRSCCEHGKG